jgi:5'(3')-deoxyribonucleotidase
MPNKAVDPTRYRARPTLTLHYSMIDQMMKKILYVDMDNVLVDFPSAFSHFDADTLKRFEDDRDEIPGIFSLMEPMPGAIEAFKELSQLFDTYILSTSPWENPSAWSDKLLWVKQHLGEMAHKRLILSHHKNLNRGDYLIDDRTKNGADRFQGELILFGSDEFNNWEAVVSYLRENAAT